MGYNVIMQWLLRSPLHGLLSKNTLLLTYTGRRSGKGYSVPVNYVREEDDVWIVSRSERVWWRNFRQSAPVTVRLQGKKRSGYAQTMTAPEDVAAGLQIYFRNMPQSAQYFNVRRDDDRNFRHEDVLQATQDRVIVRVHLE